MQGSFSEFGWRADTDVRVSSTEIIACTNQELSALCGLRRLDVWLGGATWAFCLSRFVSFADDTSSTVHSLIDFQLDRVVNQSFKQWGAQQHQTPSRGSCWPHSECRPIRRRGTSARAQLALNAWRASKHRFGAADSVSRALISLPHPDGGQDGESEVSQDRWRRHRLAHLPQVRALRSAKARPSQLRVVLRKM